MRFDSTVFNRFRSSCIVHYSVLFLIWLYAQAVFFHQYGIVTGFEAVKYIGQAHQLLEKGSYSAGQYLFYSVEILLLAFCIHSGIGFGFAVLVQLLFNLLSVYCLYKTVEFLTHNKLLAFAGTLFFLLQYYYHLYNVHLFTESLYFSFSVIYFYFIITIKKLRWKNGIGIFLFLCILYLTRPTGVFFIPATLLYLILKFFRNKAVLLLSTTGIAGLILFYFLLNYALGSGGEFDFLLPYLDERIICGVPTINPPHELIVPVEKNSIEGLWYIITHYYPLFIKMAFKRLVMFFGMVRPYYSFGHNLFVAFYFYSLYILVLIGFRKLISRFTPEFCFAMAMLGLTALT
ncbi:MAG: glycosyltransferase family 39 protein, partial [Flavisolibacter sp.]|nr:glycosyltransferase family 39 protein [Flavisolibacter sp.]